MLKSSILFALEARALLYAVLASSFRAEPSAEVLSEVTDRMAFLKGRMTGKPRSPLKPTIDSLQKALVSATPEALEADYADLFLAGKNGRLVPSESAYLEKMIYGQATVEVIAAYAEVGFVRDDSCRESHDHIALECAFMATLAMELLEHARRGNRGELKRIVDAQSSFIELHMGRWVPGWAENVKEAAGTAFFKAVAELASSLMSADREFLAHLSGLFAA